jgi:hypothetical protein
MKGPKDFIIENESSDGVERMQKEKRFKNIVFEIHGPNGVLYLKIRFEVMLKKTGYTDFKSILKYQISTN